MALHKMNVEWKHVSTYASEKNLMTAIDKEAALYPEYNDRFIVVRTPEGRWTAVVQLDMSRGGYIGRYSFLKV